MRTVQHLPILRILYYTRTVRVRTSTRYTAYCYSLIIKHAKWFPKQFPKRSVLWCNNTPKKQMIPPPRFPKWLQLGSSKPWRSSNRFEFLKSVFRVPLVLFAPFVLALHCDTDRIILAHNPLFRPRPRQTPMAALTRVDLDTANEHPGHLPRCKSTTRV